MKIIDWFFRPKLSPLKRELKNLYNNITRTETLLGIMNDEFWRDGGVCCPYCGCPGYRELTYKNERREERVKQIKYKLQKLAKTRDAPV